MIKTGTYHPNEAGAKTLKDARPLYVEGQRVSIEVSATEVTLFTAGNIIAFSKRNRFSSPAALYEWAQAQVKLLEFPKPEGAVKAGWTIKNATSSPYGRWEVYRPNGDLYGFASSEAGARIMRTRAYQRSVKFNW